MFFKYPFVHQEGLKDCACASISMIVQYYGGYISLEELRCLLQTNQSGTNAYQMTKVLQEIGFDCKGIKTNLNELSLNEIIYPCIAHVILNSTYQHYVVIYKIDFKHKYLIIGDPQDKIKRIPFSEFEKIWDGVLLVMHPIKKIVKNATYSISQFIFSIISFYRSDFIFLVCSSILLSVFSIVSSFYFKYLADGLYGQKNYILFIFLLFLIIYCLRIFIRFFRNKVLIYFNQKLNAKLTLETFENIIFLPYPYYRNRTTGEVLSRMQDLENVRDVVSHVALSLFIDLPLSFFSFCFLFFLNSTLFLIVFIIMLLYLLIVFFYRRQISSSIRVGVQKKAEANSFLVEAINGFETVKGVHAEERMIRVFENKYISFVKHLFKLDTLLSQQLVLKEMVGTIGEAVLLFVGCLLILDGKITIGLLLSFQSVFQYFLEPIQNLVQLDYQIQEAKISLKRILEIQIKSSNNGLLTDFSLDDISICHLDFSIQEKPILLDVNLTIKKGQKVMITGASGSGKSTLFKILMRYYSISRGMVCFDQKDINDFDDVRKSICLVSQNEILFTDTLYHNIDLNQRNFEGFLEVQKLCNIDEFMDPMLGHHMLIEENGFNLSGGQKQRVILARAIMRPFDILLIDEGLNQMDVNLERKILKSLFERFPNQTILIISHRLENMDLYNQVIEFQEGKVFQVMYKNG